MNNKKQISELKEQWGQPKSDEFDFEHIEKYFLKQDHSDSSQVLSAQTIKDIDFHELFMQLDRTNSKVGQQYLYDSLIAIDQQKNFDEQEQLIEHFTQNETDRLQAQLLLSKLDNNEAYYLPSLFQDDYLQKPTWYWVIPVLSVLSFVLVGVSIFFPPFILLLVVAFVANLLIHNWNKRNIYVYTNSIPQLLILCKIARKLTKIHPNNAVQDSLKSIEKHKGGIAVFSIESNSNSDAVMIPWIILEYLKIAFLIEPMVVFKVLKELDNKRSDIHEIYQYIGKIDTALSIASVRSGADYYCKPKISNGVSNLEFRDMYHPLIENCVSNSLKVNEKSILLTGSNMSGKTTFIRTIALNALFAQTINTCFAKEFSSKPMLIFSAIRITDDLMNDKSYYFEEVMTVKELITASQADCYKLFLLDEIFKGTNTIERIAAGKAVLSYIGRDKNIVFVSTHDIELTELLKDSYELYHFTEVVENDKIHFDYKLKEGNVKTRNAIRILELNNYPAELINEAKAITKKMDRGN